MRSMYLIRFFVFATFVLLTAKSYASELVGETKLHVGVVNGKADVVLPIQYPGRKSQISPTLSVTHAQGYHGATFGPGFRLSGIKVIRRCATDVEYHDVRKSKDIKGNVFCVNGEQLVQSKDAGYRTRVSDNTQYKKHVGSGTSSNPEGWLALQNGVEYTYSRMNSPLSDDNSTRWVMTQAKRVDMPDASSQIAIYSYREHAHDIQIDKIEVENEVIDFNYEGGPYSYIADAGYEEASPYRLKKIAISKKQSAGGFDSLKEYVFDYSGSDLGFGYRLKSITECYAGVESKCYRPVKVEFEQNDTAEDTIYREELVYSKSSTTDVGMPILKSYITGDVDNDGVLDFCTYSFDEQNIVCGNKEQGFSQRGDQGSVSKIDVSFVEVGKVWKNTYEASNIYADYQDKLRAANSLRLVDINNDGYLDYCFSIKKCALNTREGKFGEEVAIEYGDIASSESEDIGYNSFIDINLDGMSDLCWKNSSFLKCAINNSGRDAVKFSEVVTIIDELDVSVVTEAISFPITALNLNGDSYVDICAQINQQFRCYLGNDSSNYIDADSGSVIIDMPEDYTFEKHESKYYNLIKGLRVSDFNRDGKSDICFVSDESLCFYYDGSGTLQSYSINDQLTGVRSHFKNLEFSSEINDSTADIVKASISLVDANGDSFTDICFYDLVYFNCSFGASSGVGDVVRLNQIEATIDAYIGVSEKVVDRDFFDNKTYGSYLRETTSLAYGPITYNGNILGNGRSSICYRSVDGISCFDIPGNNKDNLKSITGGLGIKHEFDYNSAKSEDLYSSTSGNDDETFIVRPSVKLIERYTVGPDRLYSDKRIVKEYHYENYQVTKDRTAIGFGKISEKDLINGQSMVYEYSGNYYDRNSIVFQYHYDDNNFERDIYRKSTTKVLIDESGTELSEVGSTDPYYIRLKSTDEYFIDGTIYRTQKQEVLSYEECGDAKEVVYTTNGTEPDDYAKTTKYYEYKKTYSDKGFCSVLHLNTISYENNYTEHAIHTGSKFGYDDYGRLNSELRSEVTGNVVSENYTKRIETTYSDFDSYNQPRVIEHTPGSGEEARKVIKSYHEQGMLSSEENAEGHKTTYIYNDTDGIRCSSPTKVIDPNGHISEVRYDEVCRPVSNIDINTGITEDIEYAWDDELSRGYESDLRLDSDDPSLWSQTNIVSKEGASSKKTKVYYNQFNQILRVVNYGEAFNACDNDQGHIIKDFAYDLRGNLKGETKPYYGCDLYQSSTNYQVWQKHTYDSQNRRLSTTRPDESGTFVLSNGYSENTITQSQNNQLVNVIKIGVHGQPIQISTNSTVDVRKFVYDGAGNLRSTVEGNKETTIKFDNMGNRVQISDPDSGVWNYEYNGYSEPVYATTPTGSSITSSYDGIGRKLNEDFVLDIRTLPSYWDYSDDCEEKYYEGEISDLSSCISDKMGAESQSTSWSWTYDPENAVGSIDTTKVDGEIVKDYDYNSNGFLSSIEQNTNGIQYTTNYGYDTWFRPESKTYASGLTVYKEYDYLDRVVRISLPESHIDGYNSNAIDQAYELLAAAEKQLSEEVTEAYEKAREYAATAAYYKAMEIDYRDQAVSANQRWGGLTRDIPASQCRAEGGELEHDDGEYDGCYFEDAALYDDDVLATYKEKYLQAKERENYWASKLIITNNRLQSVKSRGMDHMVAIAQDYGGTIGLYHKWDHTRREKGGQRKGYYQDAGSVTLYDTGTFYGQKALASDGVKGKQCRVSFQRKWGTWRKRTDCVDGINPVKYYIELSSQYRNLYNAYSSRTDNAYETYLAKKQQIERLLKKADVAKKEATLAYEEWTAYSLEIEHKEQTLIALQGSMAELEDLASQLNEDDGSRVTLWAATKYSAADTVQSEVFANGYTTIRTFYPHSRRTHTVRTAFGGTNVIRDLEYVYNLDGNVTEKYGNHLGTVESFDYYDPNDFNRLTDWDWSQPGNPELAAITRNYSYDVAGNIESTPSAGELSYTASNNRADQLRYNGDGTVRNIGETSVDWTIFQQPTRVTTSGRITTFEYEPGGNRIRQSTGNLSTTYIDDDLKHLIDSEMGVDKESWIHTIKVNGQVVAVIDKTLGEADKVSFIHRDLVGNADTVTDIHGNVMRITKADEQVPAYPVYAPYGELLGYASKTDVALEGEGTIAEQGSYREAFERKSSANDEISEFVAAKIDESGIAGIGCAPGKVCSQATVQVRIDFTPARQATFQGQIIDQLPGFTGHETLKEHGLIHMNGRIYSPKYARFLSADPTVPYPTRWHSYNRYMYVGGNPASWHDPSGFTELYADGQCPSCNEPPIVVTAPTPPPSQSFDQYWSNQAVNSAIDQADFRIQESGPSIPADRYNIQIWTQVRNQEDKPMGDPEYRLLGVWFTDLTGPTGVSRWEKTQKIGSQWEERTLSLYFFGPKGIDFNWSEWKRMKSIDMVSQVRSSTAIRWFAGRDFQNGDVWLTSNPWDSRDRRIGPMDTSGDILNGVTQ